MNDDSNTRFTFGMFKGMRICDVPHGYLDWVLRNVKDQPDLISAIIRMRMRGSVTTLIKRHRCPAYVPPLIKSTFKFTPISRDPRVCPSLFGMFVEYAVKHFHGISIDDEPAELLARYGLAPSPSYLACHGKFDVPTQRVRWIHESFKQNRRTVSDVCNLSFSHHLQMNSFDENDATDLYMHVRQNTPYFDSYFRGLCLPITNDGHNGMSNKISVGCVTGVIDLISNNSIIDIKCRQTDNIDEYRMQLYSYACLHHLRYDSEITRCEVMNFLTGEHHVMTLEGVQNNARHFITMLGSYCDEHVSLMNKKSV